MRSRLTPLLASVALAAVLATAAAGCHPLQPAPISLDGTFPTTRSPDSYEAVTLGLTRKTTMHADFQQVLELYATLRTPAWYAARANRDADRRHLTDGERGRILEDARVVSEARYEVELMVSLWERRENDLDRGARSTWKVVLVGDDGTEIAPVEIERERRPAHAIRAEFPMFGDFAIAYVLTFPRDRPLMGPGVKQLRLRMFGPRGAVELSWTPTT